MRIAVVGASGEVGRTMVRQLELQGIEPSVLRLFASARSAGTKVEFGGRALAVEELNESWPFEGRFDYLLMSAGGALSKKLGKRFAAAGALVIDNSSAWRMDPDVPLVVPEINGDLLTGYRGIVANPNCSTIQMVLSLSEVYRRWGLAEIVVSTYQAVSGAGHRGVAELEAQEGGSSTCVKFPAPIWRNVIPQIGELDDRGFTDEEMKMVNEPRKIFGDPSIRCWPTTVRVPVLYGHSESVFVRTARPYGTLDDVRYAMIHSPSVTFCDRLVTPRGDAEDSDATFVSRLRSLDESAFLFWNVANNVRVGAATNAVRILKRHWALNRPASKAQQL